MKNYTTIETGITVPGFHSWNDAKGEVAFLRHPHRHDFIIRIALLVSHDDRQLEFVQVQSQLTAAVHSLYAYGALGFAFGNDSCETIAKKIFDSFKDNASWVSVFEDSFNGATFRRS